MKLKNKDIVYLAAFLFLSYLCWRERSSYLNLSTLAKEAGTWPLLFLFDLLFSICLLMAYGRAFKKGEQILLMLGLMMPSIPNFPGMGSLHLAGSYCGLTVSCMLTLYFLWKYRLKYLPAYTALLLLLLVMYCHEFVVTSLMEWLYLSADLLLAWLAQRKQLYF
ncbi:MAG: hypothetical protein IIV88_06165 [Erysipelotrichaceae bacterium]|nr:hypothetical protein [Erysipelotrichaceae bacterium]MBQ5756826.1 hypothetical protein [Erysipelotrichaceae bacterium]